tara:strand:- start:859 stop:3129 length:2271 start_codon:yes stop_codon:yes gene_type:complete
LEEPTTVYQNIQSEDPTNQFVIITDDTADTIILEIEEFITDTNFKGESYDSGTGFLLPMLLFPTAESGSATLDLSFTSRIVMEIDDIQNVRLENDGGDLHYEDDGKILYEQQETTSVGYQYDFILLEESDGTNPVYIATESSMTEEVDGIGEIEIVSDGEMFLQLENVHGKHDNGFLINEEGSGIELEVGTSGGGGEIIFEDGEKLLLEVDEENKFKVEFPSVAASVRPTVSALNTGDTLNEGSFLTRGFGNRTYGSVALSELSGEVVTATGTVTQFEFDFNNLIVLEAEKGVIVLEQDTPEENSIILENNNPDIFGLLQQEDGSKIFTEEDIHTLIPAPERLCHVGLHDLILEEEGILQEAVDQIKLEDFTLDNVVQEDFIIGEFVPFLGFGDEADESITIDDNILLEAATHKSENVVIEAENGDLIADESDGSSHFVLENFFFKYYNVGTVTQTGTTITVSGGQFPSAVVENGRFYYQNGQDSTVITAVSDNLNEITVEESRTISSPENYKVEYALDDTPADSTSVIIMEAFSLDPTTERVRIDLIFNGEGDVNHGFTRGEDSDGLGTFTLSIAAFTDIVGNDIIYEDGERILAEDSIGGYIAFQDSPQNVSLGIAHSKVLNEDDSGGFISTEDHEGNETTQDDNVLLKELSDALLLEDSETETLNYVLSEEGGQMMLEDVFQVSEHKIVFDSNDSILIEDQPAGNDYRLLNLDMGKFDIETIANNTSMTINASTDFFKRSDSAILVSRTEQIV